MSGAANSDGSGLHLGGLGLIPGGSVADFFGGGFGQKTISALAGNDVGRGGFGDGSEGAFVEIEFGDEDGGDDPFATGE